MLYNSTHAAVIYLAAKATPGSTRTVAEVTAGLNLTDRQFSDGLRRVKVAARSNRWLAEVIRPPATELPQLKELLSRRLASLQVNWGMQCAALAALERMGGFVAGHKGVTVVSAVVMLTLEHLGDDAETAVQRTLQVSQAPRRPSRRLPRSFGAINALSWGYSPTALLLVLELAPHPLCPSSSRSAPGSPAALAAPAAPAAPTP